MNVNFTWKYQLYIFYFGWIFALRFLFFRNSPLNFCVGSECWRAKSWNFFFVFFFLWMLCSFLLALWLFPHFYLSSQWFYIFIYKYTEEEEEKNSYKWKLLRFTVLQILTVRGEVIFRWRSWKRHFKRFVGHTKNETLEVKRACKKNVQVKDDAFALNFVECLHN